MQDFAITSEQGLTSMSFSGADSLFNNVVLSLSVAKGSFFANPGFGLFKRPRAKNNDNTARLIKGDIVSALQWLIDTKRVVTVEVTMQRDTLYFKDRLKASVTVTAADNRVVYFDKFVEVV